MPPAPVTPPPAAPATTPAAPAPSAAPPPAPPAGGGAPPSAPEKSVFDKFDEDVPEFTPVKAAPAAPSTTPKPDKGEPAAPAPAPSGSDGVPQFKTNKELREWALNQHKTARQMEEAKRTLEARVEELSQKIPQTAADAQNLNASITQMQKRIDDYESKLRLINYEESDEYKTKFVEPYQRTMKTAKQEVAELFVREPNGEYEADNVTPVFTKRQATPQDFIEIVNMPLGQATEVAEEKFGRAASIVLNHRTALRRLSQDAYDAIETYKTKGAEMRKQEAERESQQRQSESGLWRKANEILSGDEKHKDAWGKSEDPEVQKALDAGFRFADKLFSDEHAKMPLEERVMFDAVVRHRIAAFFRYRYENQKLRHDLTTAQDEIKALRGSAPGDLPPSGEAGDTGEGDSVLDAFDKKMK